MGKNPKNFRNAVAIVTGGASGIGLAMCKVMAADGADVIIADKQREAAEAAARSIVSTGGKAEAVETDVSDFSAVERVVQNTVATRGRIDYMFNNAGIGIAGFLADYTMDHWHKVLNVNLSGVVHGIQAVYPVMLRQRFGHIVNTGSMGGLVPFPFAASYTASKYAVTGLSLATRVESIDSGIRVSVICPGVVRTPLLRAEGDSIMLYDITPEQVEKAWSRTFPADPDRFARAALRQVLRNRPIIVVPAWWKIIWWLNRLSTTAGLAFAKKYFHDAAVKDFGIAPGGYF